MGSVLAIDYGTKRIGFAISDLSRTFAFPHSVIENKGFKHTLSYITCIVSEREADLIIVGMPYNQRSEIRGQRSKKNSMEKIVCEFVKKLSEKINVPVKVVDERLSSFAAEENLKEGGIPRKKSKKYVDIEAARIVLEEFIQKINSKST